MNSKIYFCQRCVINNLRPKSLPEYKKTAAFNAESVDFLDGICPACHWAERKKSIDWEHRYQQLGDLCDTYRSSTHSFDVIVPSSGGKDSRYVADVLRRDFGMNPLTVTWAPNLWTSIGTTNFRSQSDNGFSNLLFTPDQITHKKLTTLAFQRLGHPFQPFNIGQRTLAPRLASQLGIPFVMYGENVAEYSNNTNDNLVSDVKLENYIEFNLNSADFRISGLDLMELGNEGISASDLSAYLCPDLQELSSLGLKYTYFSYFVNWNPLFNYFYAAEKTGFTPQIQRKSGTYCRHSGLDDIIEELHFYLMLLKFGNGRATWDASQEIRSGHLTRDEGKILVLKYDNEFPWPSLPFFLEYFDMSELDFWKALLPFRNPVLWKPKVTSPLYPSDWDFLGSVQ